MLDNRVTNIYLVANSLIENTYVYTNCVAVYKGCNKR